MYPSGDLILSGATLYGTAMNGGSQGRGTVFKIDTDGTNFAVIKQFTLLDGAYPIAPLTLSGSTLYGTTSAGGSPSLGTIFKVNTNGTGFATLFWFTNTTLVGNPGAGLVVSGTTLYGTAYNGVNKGKGAVFKLNTDGSGFAILKNFTGPDGATSQSGLTFIGTRLYGTTRQGGDTIWERSLAWSWLQYSRLSSKTTMATLSFRSPVSLEKTIRFTPRQTLPHGSRSEPLATLPGAFYILTNKLVSFRVDFIERFSLRRV